ncbi:MAG: FAD-dependent oxidoreductase [Flavobacteriaceae bacterium]|nr:FAD-dependent oxidoreductase [Flavobacteriaceae bacterium]
MGKKVVVIGGGIVGLSCAYYLQKEDCEVSVIEQSNMQDGASYVNAGYITPSHIISLAAPGMITKGLKWMFNSASPFYVKPRLDYDFLRWAWYFKKSATVSKVESSIKAIKDINLLSRDLYEEMYAGSDIDFHYERNGLLMLFQTDAAGEAEWKIGQRANEEGLGAKLLSKEETQAYEPQIDLDVKGSVFYACDGHMTPVQFMKKMQTYLIGKGVKIHQEEAVADIVKSGRELREVITNKSRYEADEVVLAAGSWSPILAKKLGVDIPIQAGKGYRINVDKATGIQMPAILMEAKVAVTPMQGYTRFAGTMEIGGINHQINPVRVNAIADAGARYYKGLEIGQEAREQASCGLRPCSPDGLPYIGRTSKYDNLCIAAGHAMMGWSLGPATGKLVSEIISDRKPSIILDYYDPNRIF